MTLRHLSFGGASIYSLRAEVAKVRRTAAAAARLAYFLRRLSLDLVGIARDREAIKHFNAHQATFLADKDCALG